MAVGAAAVAGLAATTAVGASRLPLPPASRGLAPPPSTGPIPAAGGSAGGSVTQLSAAATPAASVASSVGGAEAPHPEPGSLTAAAPLSLATAGPPLSPPPRGLPATSSPTGSDRTSPRGGASRLSGRLPPLGVAVVNEEPTGGTAALSSPRLRPVAPGVVGGGASGEFSPRQPLPGSPARLSPVSHAPIGHLPPLAMMMTPQMPALTAAPDGYGVPPTMLPYEGGATPSPLPPPHPGSAASRGLLPAQQHLDFDGLAAGRRPQVPQSASGSIALSDSDMGRSAEGFGATSGVAATAASYPDHDPPSASQLLDDSMASSTLRADPKDVDEEEAGTVSTEESFLDEAVAFDSEEEEAFLPGISATASPAGAACGSTEADAVAASPPAYHAVGAAGPTPSPGLSTPPTMAPSPSEHAVASSSRSAVDGQQTSDRMSWEPGSSSSAQQSAAADPFVRGAAASSMRAYRNPLAMDDDDDGSSGATPAPPTSYGQRSSPPNTIYHTPMTATPLAAAGPGAGADAQQGGSGDGGGGALYAEGSSLSSLDFGEISNEAGRLSEMLATPGPVPRSLDGSLAGAQPVPVDGTRAAAAAAAPSGGGRRSSGGGRVHGSLDFVSSGGEDSRSDDDNDDVAGDRRRRAAAMAAEDADGYGSSSSAELEVFRPPPPRPAVGAGPDPFGGMKSFQNPLAMQEQDGDGAFAASLASSPAPAGRVPEQKQGRGFGLYRLTVTTGDRAGAGAERDVHVTLVGDRGSCERVLPLRAGGSAGAMAGAQRFQRGQVDECDFQVGRSPLL